MTVTAVPGESYCNEIEVAVDALPALPQLAGDLVRLTGFPELDEDLLWEVLHEEGDTPILPGLFTLANSVLFDTASPPSNRAELFRVFDPFQSHLFSTILALAPALSTSASSLVDPRRLRLHAVGTALWAERLVSFLNLSDQSSVVAAAMLHDIGLSILNNIARPHFESALETSRRLRIDLVDAERQIYDPNHAEVAAVACTNWMLPFRICELVLAHHEYAGENDGPDPGVETLRLADDLCRLHVACEFPWETPREIHASGYSCLTLSNRTLEHLHALAPRIRTEANFVCQLLDASDANAQPTARAA